MGGFSARWTCYVSTSLGAWIRLALDERASTLDAIHKRTLLDIDEGNWGVCASSFPIQYRGLDMEVFVEFDLHPP